MTYYDGDVGDLFEHMILPCFGVLNMLLMILVPEMKKVEAGANASPGVL
jgi:hypothetical protein